jgi:hypothetical protein
MWARIDAIFRTIEDHNQEPASVQAAKVYVFEL